MQRPTETFRGDYFFKGDSLLFVNRASEDFNSPFHDHDFLEIVYIAEGAGFHHVGDDIHKVQKGHILFIPIGLSHVFRPTSTDKVRHPLSVYNCVFSPQLLRRLGTIAADPRIADFLGAMEQGRLPYFVCQDPDNHGEQLFLTMYKEYHLPQAGSQDYLHALLLQLIILLQRLTEHRGEETAPRQTAFFELLGFVEQNFDRELTLGILADTSGWSERHLQRLFLEHTQQTFHRYLQNVRIRQSQALLRETELKVGHIAERVGYRDIHSFNAVFKRCTGMTPGAYRKAARHAVTPT